MCAVIERSVLIVNRAQNYYDNRTTTKAHATVAKCSNRWVACGARMWHHVDSMLRTWESPDTLECVYLRRTLTAIWVIGAWDNQWLACTGNLVAFEAFVNCEVVKCASAKFVHQTAAEALLRTVCHASTLTSTQTKSCLSAEHLCTDELYCWFQH